ncbi:MAG: hypothetical protein A2075_02485 [Geobacteraceae bacterium GWC2_58_44]|nr:MAG: hypothetical protein A2075_02485 [Geobacteraceae bacterium GWC2_58_44]HBG06145.1 hypothetical protein [Geobacter sp.]
MVVASLVDGRVRIRDEKLKREPVLARIKEELMAAPGVTGVEANPRVGSLLVIYSAALTAVEKILKTVSELLGSGVEVSGSAEPARSFVKMPFIRRESFAVPSVLKARVLNNIGMLASLVLSIGLGIFGLKKLHILTGIVFVALFGKHFYERRAQMFA